MLRDSPKDAPIRPTDGFGGDAARLGRRLRPLHRRLGAFLRGMTLLAGLALSTHASGGVVWVALSSREPAYLETANALRSALPDDEVRIGEWHEFNFRSAPPQVLVTVGSEALRQLHQSTDKTRIVALLAPRSTLDDLRDTSAGRITGVYYEQPFARQANLLRAAFPDKTRVGIVLGPTSARYRGELAQALRRVGMEGVFELAHDKASLPEAVQHVLANSELFLALPDAEAINNQTAKFILLATYRQGVPLVGYSASFVKAGAAVAMVSSPSQIGKEAAEMVNETQPGKRLPAPRAPEDFQVLVNASVSRSLNLGLDASLMERRLRGEGGPR
jgi:putative ABC transport system substrate-binding protein